MKKMFTLAAGLIVGATLWAAPQSLNVVFDGTDNANWTTSSGSTHAVSNGHLVCTMADQGNAKYRGDLQFNSADNADLNYTLDPSKDVYLAVKFIGKRPHGLIKLEFKDGSQWFNTQWNGGAADGSVMTYGGNNVYYFQLTKDSKYTGNSINVRKLNVIISNAAVAPFAYTLDWVATFASLAEINAYLSAKDDGEGDTDEDTPVAAPVQNQNTGAGYSTLNDAVTAAASGDVLVLNQDAVIASRINVTSKAISVIAKQEGATIKADYNGIIFLTTDATAEITLGGEGGALTLDGNNLSNYKSNVIEVSNYGTVRVKDNVVIKNCSSTSLFGPAICVKNSGKLSLEGVAFENCKTVDASGNPIDGYGVLFVGTPGVSLSGNNTFANCNGEIYIEGNYTVATSDLTHATPIKVMLKDPATRTERKVFLKCNDASKFSLQNAGYKLVSDGENLTFDVSTQIDKAFVHDFAVWQSEAGDLIVESNNAQIVAIRSVGGNTVRLYELKVGTNRIAGLERGLYLIDNRKVAIR